MELLFTLSLLLLLTFAALLSMVSTYLERHRDETFTYGVSFSRKYASELELDWHETLEAILADLGVRRLRLMSYWDEIEKSPGDYDFYELDEQLGLAAAYGAKVTLCLGKRQPRWPECHRPEWTHDLPKPEWEHALNRFIERVVERYRDHPSIISWQLENEAFNRGFGVCDDHDRERVRREFEFVKKLGVPQPVIMTASDNWGLPLRKPRPDIVGFSLYRWQHRNDRYTKSPFPAWLYTVRAAFIEQVLKRSVVIHELQAEPWGRKPTWELPREEQDELMNLKRLDEIVSFTKKTGIRYMDLWGVEWWYLRNLQGNDAIWTAAKQLFR